MTDDEAAICSILVHANHQDRALVFATMDGSDLLDPVASAFFDASREIWDADRKVDAGTLVDSLTRSHKLALFGGIDGIAAFIQRWGYAPENAEFYARRVHDAAVRRRAVAVARGVLSSLEADGASTSEAIGGAITKLANCVQSERKDDSIVGTLQAICSSMENGGLQSRYLETGLPVFDSMFGGIPAGLVVVGARPGVGKSSLCLQIARYVGRADPVLVVSLEMTREEVCRVLIAQECGIQVAGLRSGFVSKDVEDRVVAASSSLTAMPSFRVIEPVSCSVSSIRAIALHHKHAHGLKLLVVDYLQRVKGEQGARYGNREQEVAYVSTALSELAKELGCPVLAPCAINREMTRTSRKPSASDLRESGNIESDAHMVVMIHRPDVTDASASGSGEDATPTTEGSQLIVAKHRGGPLGVVPFTFEGPAQRFSETKDRFS